MPLGLSLSGTAPGVVAAAEASDRIDPNVDQESYVRFLEEARKAARLKLGRRWAISLVAADRVGLVADVAEALRDAAMNVEAASYATIGGFSAMSFVVSSDEMTEELGLAERLGTIDGVTERQLTVRRLADPREPAPTADFSLWHIHGEMVDRRGVFHRLTGALARRGAWLVRFGTTRVQDGDRTWCVLDLNVALPPGVDLAGVKADAVAALADEEVRRLTMTPIAAPVEGLLTTRPEPLSFEGTRFVSIMGEAKPGLIAAVSQDMDEAGLSIAGSTMAILEGRTLAIFAVSGRRADLESAIAASAARFDLRVASFSSPTPVAPPPDGELRRFYCLTQERRGVLASAARTLATSSANIECVAARVIGKDTSACVVNMFVRCPSGAVDLLGPALQRLADDDQWIDWSFEPSDGAFTPTY